MDDKQLRELIRLLGHTALLGVVGRFLLGRNEASATDDRKPTGIRSFLPWGKSREEENAQSPAANQESKQAAPVSSRQRVEERIDAIIRSAFGDSPAAEVNEEDSNASLKSVITGAVDHHDAAAIGTSNPIEQPEVPGIMPGSTTSLLRPKEPSTSSTSATREPSKASNAMDMLQLVLDIAGAVDPTPIVDGTNALISVGRAAFTDPQRRKEHLQNAAISAVSMVPYVGDTAKLAKVPRAAKTVQRTAQAFRGGERAADATKAMTAAEKRAARASYRDATEQITSTVAGPGDPSSQGESSSAMNSPAAAGGGQPPIAVPPVANPPQDTGSPRGSKAASEEGEGIEEYASWREAIKDSGKKLLDFGGILGKGVGKAAAFIQGLHLLNTGVLALNRELAPYSGQIASAYARADAADIQRDTRKARALSDPLSGLAEEQTELKDTISSLTIPLQQIGVGILEKTTALVNWSVRITGILEPAVSALEWLASFFGQNNQQDTAWKTFFQDVSDGKFDGKRPDFMPPRRQILDNPDHGEVFGR